VIEIASVAGIATIQDAGRAGHMNQGVPPGGALVPELLASANANARNAADEAAIEVQGALTIVARGPVVLGTDDGDTFAMRDGDRRVIIGQQRLVHYVAVRGGIDLPRVLGGRGTLLVASLGGYEGRPLRRGDLVPVGKAPYRDAPPAERHASVDRYAPVRVVLGPDLDRFDPHAIDVLLTSTFAVDARSDRVGTRLGGPRLACAQDPAALSAPMVRGAIQVPPSGEPIVLGPDHPTIGGYPVIATVVRGHLGSLAGRRIGASVRFVT
jgi:biotin-dependent carboxylase-like uncharacterized protein